MTEPTVHDQMARMITGYWIAQMIYAAAKLNLADHLAAGSRTIGELAEASETHAPALYRLLRALAGVGVFAEGEDRRFSQTPLSECLRRDAPGSQRAMAVIMGEEHDQAWGDLLSSVRTGGTAFDRLYGKSIFAYLQERPDKAPLFDAAMTAIHGRETAATLEAYDFSDVRLLADVGGGNGSNLAGILERYPGMRGLLFDVPGVAARARSSLEGAGLAGRCQVVGGDFFASAPGGADAYMLRHVLHDWDDERATAILRNVYGAMPAGARLLVVESVVPTGPGPSFAKLMDLNMLVVPGGLERTAPEYRDLFAAAGFRMTRIVPTAAGVDVVEGRAENG